MDQMEFQIRDFYGDEKYWTRANLMMRLIYFVFIVLFLSQKIAINILLFLLRPVYPLGRLNLVI